EHAPVSIGEQLKRGRAMKKSNSHLTRRTVLQGAMAAPAAAARDNPIQAENRRRGAAEWQLTNVRLVNTRGFRSKAMEGYCSHQSIEAGQKLRIMASCDPPGRFQIDIFRMVYYGGAEARHMTSLAPFEAKTQPEPPVGPNRLRECKWE